MQSCAAKHNETLMWLTHFKISYNDFQVDLEDTFYCQELIRNFVSDQTDRIEKLEPNNDPVQIPGTELQRFFMHFCPGTITTHTESIKQTFTTHTHNIKHRTEQNQLAIKVSADN